MEAPGRFRFERKISRSAPAPASPGPRSGCVQIDAIDFHTVHLRLPAFRKYNIFRRGLMAMNSLNHLELAGLLWQMTIWFTYYASHHSIPPHVIVWCPAQWHTTHARNISGLNLTANVSIRRRKRSLPPASATSNFVRQRGRAQTG